MYVRLDGASRKRRYRASTFIWHVYHPNKHGLTVCLHTVVADDTYMESIETLPDDQVVCGACDSTHPAYRGPR